MLMYKTLKSNKGHTITLSYLPLFTLRLTKYDMINNNKSTCWCVKNMCQNRDLLQILLRLIMLLVLIFFPLLNEGGDPMGDGGNDPVGECTYRAFKLPRFSLRQTLFARSILVKLFGMNKSCLHFSNGHKLVLWETMSHLNLSKFFD